MRDGPVGVFGVADHPHWRQLFERGDEVVADGGAVFDDEDGQMGHDGMAAVVPSANQRVRPHQSRAPPSRGL